MNRPELYHKTVGILYDAYFADTLKHASCAACAVGNIVAANLGIKYVRTMGGLEWKQDNPRWPRAIRTITPQKDPVIRLAMLNNSRCEWEIMDHGEKGKKMQEIDKMAYDILGEVKRQIDATGYEFNEVAKIEWAFESADEGKNSEDYMFNGLVAVLNVLKEIHEVQDTDLVQANQDRFKKHYETICQ